MYLLGMYCAIAFQHAQSQNLEYAQNGVTVAGGNGKGPAANQLNEPYGIAVDANRNVYITEYYNYRVQKWAPGAQTGITVAGGNGKGSAANQFASAGSIKLDAAGNMYISDGGNHRVQKWAPGALSGVRVAGADHSGSGANELTFPAGIFLDASNNLYIADTYNFRVQKWAPGASAGITVAGGNGEGSAPNQLDFPTDVAVDAAGNVYVADQDNNRVQKWTPGALTGITVAGGHGPGSAASQLYQPTGILIDASNNLFITDQFNQRIQKWAPGATSGVTVAGGNRVGQAANQLNYPYASAFDAAGNLYVADQQNYRVQRFTLSLPCPKDVLITASSCTGTTALTWPEPRDTFPDTIRIPQYLDAAQGTMSFMGALNGHGYYKSTGMYLWPDARDISEFIGDTGVSGHLVTITSAAESGFLMNLTYGTGLTPWIGLYSTGKPGSFRWVTGEPFAYTKWASGEPNNNLGNTANVAEPFVHMYDIGLWNDQRSMNMPFITEFEKPLIQFRQISGPANGSQQSAGVYMVCYERTNSITDQKDTCCFSVTVKCPATAAGAVNNSLSATANDFTVQALKATAFPNPSSSQFTLNITSSNHGKISLQVMDITGKVVETRTELPPNKTIQVGSSLKPGVYLLEVKQGMKRIQMKMVKQSQ